MSRHDADGRAIDPDSELSEPAFRRALDHAPDRDRRPDAAMRAAIGRAARDALVPQEAVPAGTAGSSPATNDDGVRSGVLASWWRRWIASNPDDGQVRTPWRAALATVVVAGIATLLWRNEPVPSARLDADSSVASPSSEPRVSGAAARDDDSTEMRKTQRSPAAESAQPPMSPAPGSIRLPAPAAPGSARLPAPPATGSVQLPAPVPPDDSMQSSASPAVGSAPPRTPTATARDESPKQRPGGTPTVKAERSGPPQASDATTAAAPPPPVANETLAAADARSVTPQAPAPASASPSPSASASPSPSVPAPALPLAARAPSAAESSSQPARGSSANQPSWTRLTVTSSSDADRPYDADPVAALERAIRAAIASGETVDAAWPDAAEWQVAMSREDGRIVARVDVAGDLLRWREDRAAGSGREGREGKEGKQGFGTTRVLRLPPAAMQSLRAALARARPVDQAR